MLSRLPHLFLLGLPVLIFQCSGVAMADSNPGKVIVGHPQNFNADEGKSPSNPIVGSPSPTPPPPPPNPSTQPNNTASAGNNNQADHGSHFSAVEDGDGDADDQESAKSAVASGKAAPLTELLKKLKSDYPGEILNVALNQIRGQYVFNVKYLDHAGLIRMVSLNALTLEMQ